MRILISGATGQLGHSLVDHLITEKIGSPQDIICLVRNPNQASDLAQNNVTLIQGTLEDPSKLLNLLEEYHIEIIFHCAAVSDPSLNKELIFSTNIDGSDTILNAFIHSHAYCFVFCSSISVYKSYLKANGLLITEEADIGSLTKGDPYAISKRITEQEIIHLQKVFPEKQFIIARIGPICGTHDRIILPKLVDIMSKKYLPKLIDKGYRKISIIAPEDVARAIVFLARNSHLHSHSIPSLPIYNVTGEMVTYKELFDCVSLYYGIGYSNFSISFWIFQALRPIFWIIRGLFRKNRFVQSVLSKTAIAFFSNSYQYDRSKIESLGFEFRYTPLQSIQMGLDVLDPNKEIIQNCKKERLM